MKTSLLIPLLLLSLMLVGCNTAVNPYIKKSLDTRYESYKILETKIDSANVYDAINTIRSLKISTAKVSAEIESIIGDYLAKKITKKEAYKAADSKYKNLLGRFDQFEKSKDDKIEQCYYVKYEYDDKVRGMKLIVDDYYFIKEAANEAVYRSCDWDRFLLSKNYSSLKWEAEDIKMQLQELK